MARVRSAGPLTSAAAGLRAPPAHGIFITTQTTARRALRILVPQTSRARADDLDVQFLARRAAAPPRRSRRAQPCRRKLPMAAIDFPAGPAASQHLAPLIIKLPRPRPARGFKLEGDRGTAELAARSQGQVVSPHLAITTHERRSRPRRSWPAPPAGAPIDAGRTRGRGRQTGGGSAPAVPACWGWGRASGVFAPLCSSRSICSWVPHLDLGELEATSYFTRPRAR